MKYLSRNPDISKRVNLEGLKISNSKLFTNRAFNDLFNKDLVELLVNSSKTEIHYECDDKTKREKIRNTQNLGRFFSFKKMQGGINDRSFSSFIFDNI